MNWNDLALDERFAVERIAHGPQLLMSVEMADRLRILGLVDEIPAGLVLSEVGAWVYAERREHDRPPPSRSSPERGRASPERDDPWVGGIFATSA